MSTDRPTVVLTGATGFVGRHLYPALVERGYQVRCTSRDPARAAHQNPGQTFVKLDLDEPETIAKALKGADSAYYLVHGMAQGKGYRERERKNAEAFREAAAEAGLRRIVYLGGVAPRGKASNHLLSRMETGRALREGPVPTWELRAAMILGPQSASWQMCRDLAARLPIMLLPSWVETRLQPVAIDDVVIALVAALELEGDQSQVFDLPGPETASAREILDRVARQHEMKPVTFRVPLLSPRLSSMWLRLITRADHRVAKELVAGLSSDLVSTRPTLWQHIPDHELVGLDEAIRRCREHTGANAGGRAVEWAARTVSRRLQARTAT